MSLTLYPSIDLKSGRVVRLRQGRADRETVYHNDPSIPAEQYREAGADWVHVVDLDGAFSGRPDNWEAVEKILASGLRVQLGGGMRDMDTIARALDLGVARVVIGTRAAQDAGFLREAVARYGERIAVGIDARDGKVAVKGWVDTTEQRAVALARTVESFGVRTVIYTDISTDGMLGGPNFAGQEEFLESTSMELIASGGVAKAADVMRYAEIARSHPNMHGVIIGTALYEGTIDLADLIQALSGTS